MMNLIHFLENELQDTDVNFSDNNITVDIPGFKKEEISLKYEDNKLKIEAKNKSKTFAKHIYVSNYKYDMANITAKLEYGQLIITLNKNKGYAAEIPIL